MSNGFPDNRFGGGFGEFRVSTIFSLTAKTTLALFVPFILTAVVAHAPLDILAGISPSMAKSGVWLEVFVSTIVGCIVTFGAVQALRGKLFVWRDALQRTGSRFASVLGVSVAIGILVFLCAIPAIIAAFSRDSTGLVVILGLAAAAAACYVIIRFQVSVPVAVMEKKGIFSSLSRASALSEGYRWQIFLAFFGVLIPVVLAFVALAELVYRVAPELIFWVNLFGSDIIGVIGNVLAAVVYDQLRGAKEGIDVDSPGSTFD
ncbi:hypothetical protein [Methylovirgula sp. 4M-Z18]|uniref:hypothetical protein n=1 Tax=Methylovirgula sp. 4M-Z18 TaxID=2293567 RepID=UPI000E3A6953|nr:hypothetical protein [Methylovirgula sp. 4M-Z18]RFB80103.1 hypothetical protein DYH55_00705 [Methylovirgula sp. 4M-Z18]